MSRLRYSSGAMRRYRSVSERVVVGHERLGRGPARDRVQHRASRPRRTRARASTSPDGLQDDRADGEDPAGVLGDDEVDLALAVALLDVLEAVVGVGQRPQGLAQHHDPGRAHRQLAPAGRHDLALDAEPVADVDGVGEERHPVLADGLELDEQLQVGAVLAQHPEGELALAPLGDQPPRHRDHVAGFLAGLEARPTARAPARACGWAPTRTGRARPRRRAGRRPWPDASPSARRACPPSARRPRRRRGAPGRAGWAGCRTRRDSHGCRGGANGSEVTPGLPIADQPGRVIDRADGSGDGRRRPDAPASGRRRETPCRM